MVEIHKMLALSTGHLTEATAKAFDRVVQDWDGCIPFGTGTEFRHVEGIVVYPKGDFGWFLPLCDDYRECHTTRAYLPSELLAIVDFAEARGCDWLMFDRDAEQIDTLAYYEW